MSSPSQANETPMESAVAMASTAIPTNGNNLQPASSGTSEKPVHIWAVTPSWAAYAPGSSTADSMDTLIGSSQVWTGTGEGATALFTSAVASAPSPSVNNAAPTSFDNAASSSSINAAPSFDSATSTLIDISVSQSLTETTVGATPIPLMPPALLTSLEAPTPGWSFSEPATTLEAPSPGWSFSEPATTLPLVPAGSEWSPSSFLTSSPVAVAPQTSFATLTSAIASTISTAAPTGNTTMTSLSIPTSTFASQNNTNATARPTDLYTFGTMEDLKPGFPPLFFALLFGVLGWVAFFAWSVYYLDQCDERERVLEKSTHEHWSGAPMPEAQRNPREAGGVFEE